MKIVLQLTSAGGNVELVPVEAGKTFTIPDGVTAEIAPGRGVAGRRAAVGPEGFHRRRHQRHLVAGLLFHLLVW